MGHKWRVPTMVGEITGKKEPLDDLFREWTKKYDASLAIVSRSKAAQDRNGDLTTKEDAWQKHRSSGLKKRVLWFTKH